MGGMDRLTRLTQFGPQLYGKIQVRGDVSVYNDAVRKLYAYEDTGLTPDEIAALRAENAAFKADIEAGRLVRFEDGEPYWYCPHCREEVGAYSVTNGELHDRCGHPVEWIKPVKRAALEGGQHD